MRQGPRFLVIRRDNIGDLVCTLPMVRRLREHFPDAWIGALVTHYNVEVLHENEDIDEVFAYRKAKHLSADESRLAAFKERLGLLWRLRGYRLDGVLLPASGSQRSAYRMAKLVGAKKVFSHPPESSPASHEVENAATLLMQLGVNVTALPAACVHPHRDTRASFSEKLGTPAGAVIGLHISARKPTQRWEVMQYVMLVREICVQHPTALVVLLWAPGAEDNQLHPGDDHKAADILQKCAGLRIQGVPTSSLRELIAVLSLLDILICSDGGHMHLAAALGTPMVCLFGQSDAARWHPWGVDYELLQPTTKKVGDLAVPEVLGAFERLMARTLDHGT